MSPNSQPALLHCRTEDRFDYGPKHPVRMERLPLTYALMRELGLDQGWVDAQPATFAELATHHDRRYLETLQELSQGEGVLIPGLFGLGGENPVFDGVYDYSALLAGASLQAARLVRAGHPVAFNPAGGNHHALAGRASGFCFVNDPVLAALELARDGKRVMYLDLDVHHGDGVQWAFWKTDQVLTVSLHQHPETHWPGTGYLEEMGEGPGRGFNVNLPLWPHTDDAIYLEAFRAVVPPLIRAYEPDYVITQLGVDTFHDDPLGNLHLTPKGYRQVVEELRELCWGRWVALGGGGYRVANVPRAFATAWAVMVGQAQSLPERVPEAFCRRMRLEDQDCLLAGDTDTSMRGRYWERAAREARQAVAHIHEHIFPLLGARP